MKSFPIMLNVAGLPAVVVGGGSVGLRKAGALLEAGAKVLLVAERTADAPPVSPNLEILRRSYEPSLLDGAKLVFACTDDMLLNARIAADGRAVGAWVNAADQPEDCDFYLPAVARDGDVTVAVGTGGSAPALAAWLSRRIAQAMPQHMAEFAATLHRFREELRDTALKGRSRMAIMRALSGQEGYDIFMAGGPHALRAQFQKLLSAESDGRDE